MEDKDMIIRVQAARIEQLERQLQDLKVNQDTDYSKIDNEFKEALGMQ